MARDDDRWGRRERHEGSAREERGRQDDERFRGMEREEARFGAREDESRGFYDAGGRGESWTSRESHGREGPRQFQNEPRGTYTQGYGMSEGDEPSNYGNRQGSSYGMSGGSAMGNWREDERQRWGRQEQRDPNAWSPESARYGQQTYGQEMGQQDRWERERREREQREQRGFGVGSPGEQRPPQGYDREHRGFGAGSGSRYFEPERGYQGEWRGEQGWSQGRGWSPGQGGWGQGSQGGWNPPPSGYAQGQGGWNQPQSWERERGYGGTSGGGGEWGRESQGTREGFGYAPGAMGAWGVTPYEQRGGRLQGGGGQGAFGFTGQGQDRFSNREEFGSPYAGPYGAGMGGGYPGASYTTGGLGGQEYRPEYRPEYRGSQGRYGSEYYGGRRDSRDWEGASPEWRGERGFGHTGREDDRSLWQKVKDNFTGRGPRGYRRSDERIREDVSDRLTDHPGIDASDVDVDVKDGEVTLKGTLPSREQKRMAEDVIENCPGVREIHNHIRVQREHSGTQWASSGVGAMAGTSTYYGSSGGGGENVMAGSYGMAGSTGLRSTTGQSGMGAVSGTSSLPGGTSTATGASTRERVRNGMAVVDIEGKRVGVVSSSSTDHFDVQREGKNNLHVPFTNVNEMRGELVMLDRKLNEIDRAGWEVTQSGTGEGQPRER